MAVEQTPPYPSELTTGLGLPENALRYLAFMSQTIAPIAMATYGQDLGDYLTEIRGLKL